MKSKYLKIAVATSLVTIGIWGCKKDFLETSNYGNYADDQILSAKGIDAILIGAYGQLDGEGNYGANWTTPATNWVYGDIASDDAYKGTDANDQPNMTAVEIYNWLPSNDYFYSRWIAIYDGVARANDVLRLVTKTLEQKPDELTQEQAKVIVAQAKFIRAFEHFEAKRMWNNVPIQDETATENKGNSAPGNAEAVWAFIEKDLTDAIADLPETYSEQIGRVNKYAAMAYLAKAKLYQHKFAEAKAIFTELIPASYGGSGSGGVTSNGLPYALQDAYWKNYDPRYENSGESVFAIQFAAQGSQDGDANRSYGLAFPYGGEFGCCGFLQPSQNLVNAHKTVGGLPMPNFNAVDVKSDEGKKTEDDYTVGTEELDPRVDWSVGRRGIPYYDWGPHPGSIWIRDMGYAGPYSPKKHVFSKADVNGFTSNGWKNLTAKNYYAMRFADLLLMAAECEVEVGSLEKAREYVNYVRARTKNPDSWVQDSPAKYVINEYSTPWSDQAVAREAVRTERRLELAVEGHRFFDLVRYGDGYAVNTLNSYLAKEQIKRLYLKSSSGFKLTNSFYPIPERAIVLAKGALIQNEGY